jgi:tetratricopeptide (TPR) repeat protein
MTPADNAFYDEADALFALRSDVENVQASVAHLSAAAAGDFEAAWRLGRAYFFLGQEATGDRKVRDYFKRGVESSSRSVQLQPERVEGNFWLGVNLALLAGSENPLSAAVDAVRAKNALQRAVRIDPTYHGAGPLRVLGRLQHRLPGWLGGGTARARANFERAVEIAPDNTVTRIYFAELLSEIGDASGARAQLEAILSSPANPDWVFEAERDRKLASLKLSELMSDEL